MQMTRLMDTLRSCFDLLPDAEITMEGNPDSVDLNALRQRFAGYPNLELRDRTESPVEIVKVMRDIVPTFKTPDEVNRAAEAKLKDAE